MVEENNNAAVLEDHQDEIHEAAGCDHCARMEKANTELYTRLQDLQKRVEIAENNELALHRENRQYARELAQYMKAAGHSPTANTNGQ